MLHVLPSASLCILCKSSVSSTLLVQSRGVRTASTTQKSSLLGPVLLHTARAACCGTLQSPAIAVGVFRASGLPWSNPRNVRCMRRVQPGERCCGRCDTMLHVPLRTRTPGYSLSSRLFSVSLIAPAFFNRRHVSRLVHDCFPFVNPADDDSAHLVVFRRIAFFDRHKKEFRVRADVWLHGVDVLVIAMTKICDGADEARTVAFVG